MSRNVSPYLNYLLERGEIEPQVAEKIQEVWPDERSRFVATRNYLEGKRRLLVEVTTVPASPIPEPISVKDRPTREPVMRGAPPALTRLAVLALVLYGAYKAGSAFHLRLTPDRSTESTSAPSPVPSAAPLEAQTPPVPPTPHVPIPKHFTGSYYGNHQALLVWKSVGKGYTYRIYRAFKDGQIALLNKTQPWTATRALVNVNAGSHKEAYLGLTAVSPDGQSESDPTGGIKLELNASNDADTIEPAPAN